MHGKPYKFLKDAVFANIRNSLDAVMKQRQKQGLGCNPNQANLVEREQEEFLWTNNILGMENPKKLICSLIYLLGVNLMLRASEHRLLRVSMFEVRKL